MDELDELVEAMKLLVYLKMTNPRGGNGSVRIDENKIAITPSGLLKHRLTVDDLVVYDMENRKIIGKHKPSMELPTHELVYMKKKEAKAILHAHPIHTIALTDIGLTQWWKAGLVESEYSVGEVKISRPAPPGSLELAEEVVNGFMEGARLVIVPRHGVFSWGRSVGEALDAIIALEETAEYVATSMIIDGLKNLMRRL